MLPSALRMLKGGWKLLARCIFAARQLEMRVAGYQMHFAGCWFREQGLNREVSLPGKRRVLQVPKTHFAGSCRVGNTACSKYFLWQVGTMPCPSIGKRMLQALVVLGQRRGKAFSLAG